MPGTPLRLAALGNQDATRFFPFGQVRSWSRSQPGHWPTVRSLCNPRDCGTYFSPNSRTDPAQRSRWCPSRQRFTRWHNFSRHRERRFNDVGGSQRFPQQLGTRSWWTVRVSSLATSLPGQHELEWEPSFGSSPADQASMPLAGQADGAAWGSRGHAGDREKFSVASWVTRTCGSSKLFFYGKHEKIVDRREKVA